jgi:hypothetical protein
MQDCRPGKSSASEDFSYRVKHAIYKGRRLITAEALGDLNRLIDGDLIRNIVNIEHFTHRQPQHIPVCGSDSRKTPVDRGLRDQIIDPTLVDHGLLEQFKGIRTPLLADLKKTTEMYKSFLDILKTGVGSRGKIILKKKLQSGLTCLSTSSHRIVKNIRNAVISANLLAGSAVMVPEAVE